MICSSKGKASTRSVLFPRRLSPYWYPQGYDMTGFSRYQRDALYYYGVKEVADLFTKRNLWGLASIKSAIEDTEKTGAADALKFAFSAILLNCSRLYRYRP